MLTALWIVSIALLLALNAFFVLAEFAIVKVRASRVEELEATGDARAKTLAIIRAHLDEHLGVCQVGITLASVALGMVGNEVAEAIAGPLPHAAARNAAGIAVSYVLVSGSHIVLGELVPKSIAIRVADAAALWTARPLRFFRALFFPALWLLNTLSVAIVGLMRLPRAGDEHHSEEELRIILDDSQEQGLMSFRRLLFMENVFDLGTLAVRDAMRPRGQVVCLDARAPWDENLRIARAARFTRYPLVEGDSERPVGFVHLKDVLLNANGAPDGEPDLVALARPAIRVAESARLETLLAEMQQRGIHTAFVTDDAGRWSGLVTLEDAIEEIVGTIRDEFEDEETIRLSDVVSAEHVHMGVEADSPSRAVAAALARMNPDTLPLPATQIVRAVEERERQIGTYVGHGIAMPHARLAGIARPFALILRSEGGVPCRGTAERASLLFVTLTPAGQPRVHQRLQSGIAQLLHDSRYVTERLLTAESPEEILDVIRVGEQASLVTEGG
ncbi:MAG: DUF21 domain-containing protein [Deltaproteobacteria bacterium]|nr:DUF21 domain-containing protein [Deltaproteobacteria bacterium]